MTSPLERSPVAKKQRYLTFSERYFTPLYKLNYASEGDDSPKASPTATPTAIATTQPAAGPGTDALSDVNQPATATVEATVASEPAAATLPEAHPFKATAPIQDHVKILLHSNGICVLTLAPSHPILTDRLTPTTVDFQVSKRVNRLQNSVKGKGKKGGQFFADDKQV